MIGPESNFRAVAARVYRYIVWMHQLAQDLNRVAIVPAAIGSIHEEANHPQAWQIMDLRFLRHQSAPLPGPSTHRLVEGVREVAVGGRQHPHRQRFQAMANTS